MAHRKKRGRKASPGARASAAELFEAHGSAISDRASGLALLAAWEHFVENGSLPNAKEEGSTHEPARGRSASGEARDAARDLLNIYGPPLRSLSGTFCINPDSDPEDHIVVSYQQAAQALLDAMVRLANTGWLVETEVKLDRVLIREEFMAVRHTVPTTKAAIEKLAEKHHRSPRDVERLIRKKKP